MSKKRLALILVCCAFLLITVSVHSLYVETDPVDAGAATTPIATTHTGSVSYSFVPRRETSDAGPVSEPNPADKPAPAIPDGGREDLITRLLRSCGRLDGACWHLDAGAPP